MLAITSVNKRLHYFRIIHFYFILTINKKIQSMFKNQCFILLALLGLGLFNGCKEPQESSNPFFKRGLALEASHRYTDAESAYLQCLGRHPDHKMVLYRLGFLYECYLNQPALAVHYYQKYLPHEYDRRKEQILQDKINELQEKYLAVLLETSAGQKYSESISQKLEENYEAHSQQDSQKIQELIRQQSILRNKILTLTRALDVEKKKNHQAHSDETEKKTEIAAVVPPKPLPPVAKPNAQPKERVYVVKSGDTLGQISKTMYGTAKKWRLILEKNHRTLKGSDKNLRPGMHLLIPADQDSSVLEEPAG